MTIPFLDVRASSTELGGELNRALQRVVDSGRYVLGQELLDFERTFADYTGAEHCVGVGSGLDALHLALRAVGIGPGHGVIVPAHTFAATWLAVVHAGAQPIPVDVDQETFNLDIAGVEDAITAETRAIVAVHLYGQPVDMDPLLDIARRHGIAVVEDASQAHGARYHGRRIGTLGAAASWSFYPSKNLGGIGDGGAITTNDSGVAERLRILRNYGASDEGRFEVAGFNSRLDETQAAVLRLKLARLDQWNGRRREIAAMYSEALSGTGLGLPVEPSFAESVWHQFVLRSRRRDALRAHLERNGVPTAIHYPVPPHRQPVFARFAGYNLPVASAIADEALSLPIGPHMSDGDVAHVIAAVNGFDQPDE